MTKENQQSKVTLITAVRDCREETADYLASLQKYDPEIAHDLVIVDDGSGDSTRDYLRSSGRRHGFKLLRNEHSRGFAFANNRGTASAKSEWLLFMNNDLVLTKDWFAPFKQVIEGKTGLAEPGCIGNVQLDPRTDNIDHAGVSFASGVPRHFLQGESEFPKPKFLEFLAVTGACFMIRRDLFLKVGGFDESYRTGFEDIDLCLRLRMLGFRHYVANQSRIYHKRGSSSERNEHQAHNSKVFYGRWGKLITRFEEWDRLKSTNKNLSAKERKIRESLASSMEVRGEGFLFSDFSTLLEVGRDYLRKDLVKCARRVSELLELNFPEEAGTWELSGVTALRMKKMKDAKASFLRAVQYEPSKPKHYNNLGEVHRQAESFPEAIRHFREALKLSPVYAKAHYNLGLCKLAQGRPKEAEKAFRQAVLFDPDHAKAWRKLGVIREEAGFADEAMAAFRQFLRLSPKDGEIRERLAALYESANRSQEALALLQVGAQVSSLGANGLLRGGRLAYALGRFEQAESWLLRCLESDDLNWEAWHYLGNVRVGNKDFAGAVLAYERALEIQPEHPPTFNNLANCRAYLCDWSSREDDLSTIETFRKEEALQVGVFEVGGLQLSEKEEVGLAKKKAKEFLDQTKGFRDALNFRFDKRTPGKKRIGFLSSDLRNHAVGHLFAGLVQNLDTEKFETFVYSTSPDDGSDVRKTISEASGNFRELFLQPLVRRARMIHDDDLDLLVDLGGFSMGNNAELLALRPARRQAQFLGYASSMGKGIIDCLIADNYVLPKSSRKLYSEEVVCMAGPCLPPGEFTNFAKRSARKAVGLPVKGIVFCAFHAAYKIDPQVFDAWMSILKAVPDSILWLKFKPAESAMKNLRAEAVRRGIPSRRLIMADDLDSRSDHLSRMSVADLFLDCPSYNGHASSMDALHAKLPILTIKGTRFCNRVGESLLKYLGLPQMVARDLEEYEKKAIELGCRPSLLLPLRKAIQENADQVLSPVCHARLFEKTIDGILAKPLSRKKTPKKTAKVVERSKGKPLQDLTILMLRPEGVTNWTDNVSQLSATLAEKGGAVMVVEDQSMKGRRSEYHSSILLLRSKADGQLAMINQALAQVRTSFVAFLDDPLRAMPVALLLGCMMDVIREARARKVGYLGIASSMEPHTGCLVTQRIDKGEQRKPIGGFFAPCFLLSLEALRRTGGFKSRWVSLALASLDLSLRMEREGFASSLIESDGILCPVHSGKEYLSSSPREELEHFVRIWKRKPFPLKPKYSPKDEQVGETPDYQEWIRLCDTISEDDLMQFREEADHLPNKPSISVIMPVFDPPRKFLEKAIQSVLSQAYENWELCMADDASTKKFVRPLLEKYARQDSRIKVAFRKTNGHISVASNSALKLAKGEYVAFLDHDDELRPHALLEVAKVINKNPDANLIYSDEDIINEIGDRLIPHFKVGWDDHLILGQNYVCHLTAVSMSEIRKIRGFRKKTEGAQDWDLVLRISENINPSEIFHIEKILYHWRRYENSTAKSLYCKPYVINNARKVLEDKLERNNINGTVICIDEKCSLWRIENYINEYPKVSIIIPIRDRVDLLRNCLNSINDCISDLSHEVIIVNNSSVELDTKMYLKDLSVRNSFKIININADFNYSMLNNIASSYATGEVLFFLNNDIEIIERNSLKEMLALTLESNTGLVGAKLLYYDNTIQHAGVFVGVGNSAGHMYKGMNGNEHGNMGHLSLVRSVTACTGACMMILREKFLSHGGFNESDFKVAFNDVDLSLRLVHSGLVNIWTPNAIFYHHESASRGYNNDSFMTKKRMKGEIHRLASKWNIPLYEDKYYNSNYSRISERLLYSIQKYTFKADNVSYDRLNRGSRDYKSTWTKLATNYNTAVAHVSGHHSENELDELGRETIRQITNCFEIGVNDIVLEIGCGVGRVGKILSNMCLKWIGCDISAKMVKFAKWRMRGIGNVELIELHHPDLRQIDDSTVDVVYCTVVFMHLDEWDRYKYVSEAYRVLKPGGRFYVDNFNLNSDEGWSLFLQHCNIPVEDRNPAISVSSTPQELQVYLERSNFHNVKVKELGLWVFAFGVKIEDNPN